MNRKILPIMAIAFAFVSFQALCDTPKPKQVDKLFAEWSKPDSPGCAIAVIRDGKIVYEHG